MQALIDVQQRYFKSELLEPRFADMRARISARTEKARSRSAMERHIKGCKGRCRKCAARDKRRAAAAKGKRGPLCRCGRCKRCISRASTRRYRQREMDRGAPVDQWPVPQLSAYDLALADATRMAYGIRTSVQSA